MFDQPIIRICLVLGSLITATYILRRVRLAKVQIEDTIFWLLFSGILLILAIFPGIAYWAAYLLGFQSPINFVYIVIIFLLLAKQFFMSIRLSQLDSKVRILTQRVALNEEKISFYWLHFITQPCPPEHTLVIPSPYFCPTSQPYENP